MAEEPKITFKDWGVWISLDEYNGGSYLFSKWIKASNNCFKLDDQMSDTIINNRSTGYIISQSYSPLQSSMIMFTEDWYVEWERNYNQYSYLWWVYTQFNTWNNWPFYKAPTGYINSVKVGETYVWIRADKIDTYTFTGGDWMGILWTEVLLNPWLTSNTSRTVWAWWTTGANGATHTSWSWTNTLQQSITTLWTSWMKINILVSDRTTGTIQVSYNWSSLGTLNTTNNWLWYTFITTATWWAANLTLTPSNTFNGTVKYIDVREITSNLEIAKATITSSTTHPALYDWWDIFICSWDKIDVLSTFDWTVETKSIIQSGFSLVSINRIWDKFVMFATDWVDSQQYYWDWVSDEVLETINWIGNKITGTAVDGNKLYVVCEDWPSREVYLVSGYDKQLVCSNNVSGYSTYISYDSKRYEIENKFNISIRNTNCIAMAGNKLVLSAYYWLYTYWKDKPTEKDRRWYIYTNTDNLSLTIDFIYSLWYTGTYLSVWLSKNYNLIWTVNVLSKQQYASNFRTWYLLTTPIYWDSVYSNKSLTKLKIGFYWLDSTKGNIKIYANCDDHFFWTADVTGVTTTPAIWSIYQIWSSTVVWEVIDTDITGWVWTITLKTTQMTTMYYYTVDSNATLTKTTGTWDDSIECNDIYNYALVKTITQTNQWYGNEYIFSQAFVDAHMPDWHKLTLKVELNSPTTWYLSPEVYDISLYSDIVSDA